MKRAVFAAIIAMGIAAVTPASAGVITQSQTLNGSPSQLEPFGGTFHQFAPALGTLNSVSLNFSGSITYFVSFSPDNPDCSPLVCSPDFFFSTGFNFNAPGFPLTVPNSSPFFNVVNWAGNATGPILSPQNSGPLGVDSGTLLADSAFLNSYIGLGTIDVVGAISMDSDTCFPAFAFGCGQTSSLSLTTTLSYDFTPVPEPLTVSLFSAGLAGVVISRRRRSKTPKS